MADKQKTIVLMIDDNPVEITVRRANAVRGVQRYQLMIEAERANETEPNDAIKPLRFFTYPDCMAGTVEVKGVAWPMPFTDFIELDEDVVNDWTEAVYAVNPNWRAGSEPKDTAEKKG